MMMRRVARWLDDRVGASSFTRQALTKVFPDHWSFMIGEIALYSFVVLVVTGVFLSLFFDPSVAETTYEGSYGPLRGTTMSEAYRSVVELSFDVRAGLVMRQTHHWAALVFVAALVLHLLRVFFTGAFRRPRELNWVVGLTLFLLAIFNGFTGYSLPDDLLSGTGLRIAYSIALSVPVVGTWVAYLVFGGEFPDQEVIPRLFVTHIMIVPAAIAALLTVHLALVWRQKHTDFEDVGRAETNVVGPMLWPTYAAHSVGLFFAVFAVLATMGGLAQVNPVWLYGAFEPSQVPSPAQPDWYLGWTEGALRLFPPWELRAFGYEVPNPFYPGVLVPTVLFGALYAWPFLEARFGGDRGPHHLLDRPRDHPVRIGVGVGALTFLLLLQAAASNDLLAHGLDVSVATVTRVFRVAVLVVPPVAGYLAYRLMQALQATGAPGLAELPLDEALAEAGEGEADAATRAGAGKPPGAADRGELRARESGDGGWRWSWTSPTTGRELHGNKAYAERAEAERAATRAFPDAPVRDQGPPGPSRGGRRAGR